jgi:hypothetical protein
MFKTANLFDPVVPGQMWNSETGESVPIKPHGIAKPSVQKTRIRNKTNRQRAMQPSQLPKIELKKLIRPQPADIEV